MVDSRVFLECSEEYIEQGLTPTEVYILLCKKLGKEIPEWMNNAYNLKNLRSLGLLDEEGQVTINGDKLIAADVKQLKKASKGEDLVLLAEKIMLSYPRITLYKQSARGTLTDVVTKLRWFFKTYKYESFTHDEVNTAVAKYASLFDSNDGYKFMKLLKYLIGKDNQSVLAGIISAIREGTFEEKQEEFRGDKIDF